MHGRLNVEGVVALVETLRFWSRRRTPEEQH